MYKTKICQQSLKKNIIWSEKMQFEERQELYHSFKALYEMELIMSEFYKKCAERFEDDKEFWLGVSKEEKEHSENLIFISEEIIDKPDSFKKGKDSDINKIKEFIMKVKDKIAKLEIGLLSWHRAMMIAKEFEVMTIEMEYPNIVKTIDPTIKNFLKLLHEESIHHKKEIERMVELRGKDYMKEKKEDLNKNIGAYSRRS